MLFFSDFLPGLNFRLNDVSEFDEVASRLGRRRLGLSLQQVHWPRDRQPPLQARKPQGEPPRFVISL